MSSREWWKAPFGHIVRALITLYRNEKSGKPPLSIGELIEKSGIPESTFHRSIKRALEEGGLVEYKILTKERIIEVHLTPLGRELAEKLNEVYDKLKL